MSDDSPMGAITRARKSVNALRRLALIRREGRTHAEDDEWEDLLGWSGWGPLAPTFAPKSKAWLGMAEEIKALLSPEDLDLGHRATYSAFYTPDVIAQTMWRLLQDLGFTTGTVLEPGCGGGVFMRNAPKSADMVGVERDPTTAAITQLLNPDAIIHASPFESARLEGGFAAAIGNVPFGNVGVHDPIAPRACRASVHNYFIHRTLRELAPGGIAVLLTSRFTMDATASYAREEISQIADFIGAVRLPNGALSGGTETLADIVVLRRKTETRPPRSELDDWLTTRLFVPGASINKYWDARPDMVLGAMTEGPTNQYGLTVQVDLDLKELPGRLNVAADTLYKRARDRSLLWQPLLNPAVADFSDEISADGWHEGSFRMVGRDVIQMVDGKRKRVTRPAAELLHLMQLRDLAVQLVDLETDHDRPDEDIEPVRASARACYLAYVEQYGAINRCVIEEDKLPVGKPTKTAMQEIADNARQTLPDDDFGLTDFVEEDEPSFKLLTPRLHGFRKDPDFQLVQALERYDEDTQEHEPAPILSTRQNRRIARPERTDDPLQALAWSLDRNAGKVDLQFIANMLDRPVLGVTDVLGDAVYHDPATRTWVEANEYLSGNVREKLRIALVAAAADKGFERNVTALQGVLPKWLEPHEISAQLGMVWIDVKYVQEYVDQLLGWGSTIKRLAHGNQWEVKGGRRGTPASSVQWGTADRDAFVLIEDALNNRTPVVKVRVTVGDREVMRKDAEKSMLAAQKQQEIQANFGEWLWSDVHRADELCAHYNDTFNALRARKFDGSHITIAGMAPWFKPYPHQLEYVARAISTRASLCGHPVGAGKTATMAMVAMKLRELGLAENPMIAVPKHLLEQTARQMRQLFPAAKILAVSTESIGKNRRAFAARCATGKWDMVIITHPAFDKLRVSELTEARYMQRRLSILQAAIRSASPDGELETGMVKAAAKRADELEKKIRDLRQRAVAQDIGVTFEQLGVSIVMVDEAHYYKNLASDVRIEGFNVRAAKRATDLHMKLEYLSTLSTNPYAALFTGTPVSNTMLELYVLLNYLMSGYMQDIGMGTADAWASTFVQFVTSVDVTVDGGSFNLKRRPALFVNAPELRLLLSMVADIRTAEQLGLSRPEMVEEIVDGPPTQMQEQYSAELVERVEEVRKAGRYIGPGSDNMLKICTDGRMMATDPALVGMRDPERGKLHRVAEKVLKVWREHPEDLQIVFCDIGTPNAERGPQTYGRLRQLLIDGGMPAGRVEFIHSAKNGNDKAALFSRCRTGKLSVIMGSTDKLGVGTNIQNRVIAMHHVDAPFRPSDVEQRDGRGLRPGNRNKRVFVFRYITQRTFDAYMWQMLARKIGFITQILSGVLDRTVEDIVSDRVLSYAAIKALATGQPLLEEKARVEGDIKRLRGMERSHRHGVDRMRHQVRESPGLVAKMESELAMWTKIGEGFTGEFTDADKDQLAEMVAAPWNTRPRLVAGMRLSMGHWWGLDNQRQPTLNVWAEGTKHEIMMAGFHTVDDYLAKLQWVTDRALLWPKEIRAELAEHHADVAKAQALVNGPFAQADELTSALARLDQINAELHAAATAADQDAEVTDADREAEEQRAREIMQETLNAAVNDLLGSLRGELNTAVNDLLATFRR